MKKLLTLILVLSLSLSAAYAQQTRVISGTVVDENNEPLAGADVLLDGTNTATTTNADGTFRISIPTTKAGQILLVSFTGMKPGVLMVDSIKGDVTVTLTTDLTRLEDAVVTGYTTLSKERATGSFGVVTAKEVENKLGSNLINRLEGKISGLVLDKDGVLSIRGRATLNAETAPLIVVDGYPVECKLTDLNPDNIENITILKDAVAASIYGARSANGVIIVTTKHGQEGKLKVSYTGTFMVKPRPNLDYLHMASTDDYIDAELFLFKLNPATNNPASRSTNLSRVNYLISLNKGGYISEEEMNSRINELRGINALDQMQKYMFRTALTQTHNINISGGSSVNRYNLAVNYAKSRGSYLNTDDDRLVIDLNNEWKPLRFLTVGIATNLTYSNHTEPWTQWQTLTNFSSYVKPYTQIVDDNGNPVEYSTLSYASENLYNGIKGGKSMGYSPIKDAYEDYLTESAFSSRINGFIKADIAKGLSAEVGGSWSRRFSDYKQIATKDSYRMRMAYNNSTSISNPTNHYVPDGALINETRYSEQNWTLRGQVNFNRVYGRHRISALAGSEVRRISQDNNTYATRIGYNAMAGSFSPVNAVDFKGGKYNSDMVGGSSGVTLNYGSYSIRDNRFVSFYFNGSYEYDNRYLISGSIREDLTNFFGTNPKYRYKPLWSIGGTWKISNEEFFDVDWIKRLNLRASYGINGNISLTQGPYMILGVGSFNNDTQGITHSISSYPNGSLRWEKTKTTNIGLDFDVLDGRLGLSADRYFKHSTDILANDAIDPTLGVSSMTKNVGAIQNNGFEATVYGSPVSTKNFQWNVSYNLSLNHNEVLSYNVSRNYPTSWAAVMPIHAEGHPMYGLYGYKFSRIDDKGQVLVYGADGEEKLASLVEVDDIEYQGSTVPTTDMALTNSFDYKNWSLSFMFIAKFGAKYRKDVFQGSNINSRYVGQRWKEAGDEAKTIYPTLKSWNMDLFYYPFCDIFVGNANYAKLRDVTLSYTFDKSLISRIGLGNLRVYVQARDLFRITAKDCDIDPETMIVESGGAIGASTNAGYTTLPRNAEFYGGINITF
ncbi:MAG: SusC/RagA family TonB-linked outer membrane protein [Bacteroidales bacterium]|nr:SusC/RagA family TonB-linked outer membrane protein [Bacteroidales bacterium]